MSLEADRYSDWFENVVTQNTRFRGCQHYVFYITPDQLQTLIRLAGAVNQLFKKSLSIDLFDLIYAALWRGVSMLGSPSLLSGLTIIPQIRTQEMISSDREPGSMVVGGGSNGVYRVHGGTDFPIVEPLVAAAQHIRRSFECDTEFEGWLIDGLSAARVQDVSLIERQSLICSAAALPQLLSFLAASHKEANPENPIDVLPRICCINRNGFAAFEDPSEKRVADSGASVHRIKTLSVDMLLPASEIELFKQRYGDEHTVPSMFLEN